MSCLAAWTCLGLIWKYPGACFIRASEADRAEFIERFHSCVQHLCTFIGKKEGVYIRKEFNSQRIALEHQYGCRDVIWKRSIARSPSTTNINYCSKQPRIHNLNASTIAGQFSLCLQFQRHFLFKCDWNQHVWASICLEKLLRIHDFLEQNYFHFLTLNCQCLGRINIKNNIPPIWICACIFFCELRSFYRSHRQLRDN